MLNVQYVHNMSVRFDCLISDDTREAVKLFDDYVAGINIRNHHESNAILFTIENIQSNLTHA